MLAQKPPPENRATTLLKLDRIEKSFSGVQALKPVSFELTGGQVLGLIGENGAGKSTLIKILSGVHTPDAGTILWKGAPVHFASPHEALRSGIATIHQELACFGTLSVAENLLLGTPWPRHAWGAVDWRRLHEQARATLDQFAVRVATERRFNKLSSAQKQEVAIARALSQQAQLLILDEPTASLSEPEVERLFQQLQRLRREGLALIYVSHRLDEILKLTDRVAVLRDGELVASYASAEADVKRLVRDMVGRPLDQVYPHTRSAAAGSALLRIEGLSRAQTFHDIHLEVRRGEIVGLAGLVGAGRSELARAIFGLYSVDRGSMWLDGRAWEPRAADASVQAGVVYIPEERKRQGLVLDHSVGESISIGFSDLLVRCGLINRPLERVRIDAALRTYGIRAKHAQQPVGTLSGGNQQKTVLARWLDRDPKLIILDEPTRGVDVGAKAEIHKLIDALAAAGKAILLISSDLPEVIGMSDRVLVMCNGALSAELRPPELTQENVILAASGLSHAGADRAGPAFPPFPAS